VSVNNFFQGASPSSSGNSLKSSAVFAQMSQLAKSAGDLLSKINAIFLYNITQGGQTAASWSEF
jgi:hypothetical protein